MYIWLGLTIVLGALVLRFYARNVSSQFSSRGKAKNKLGKAMINMERSSVFGDCVNFYEFAKYAVREAMHLPQGKVGMSLTVEDIKKKLEEHSIVGKLRETVVEIYEIAEQASRDENLDVDLKFKLGTYYEAIRELNENFGKKFKAS
jgi:hypothetical protein